MEQRIKGDDGYEYTVIVDALWAWVFKKWTWRVNNHGYCYRSTSTRKGGAKKSYNVYLHRLVAGLEYGDGLEADHVNTQRGDCRGCNLEVVAPTENKLRRHTRQT